MNAGKSLLRTTITAVALFSLVGCGSDSPAPAVSGSAGSSTEGAASTSTSAVGTTAATTTQAADRTTREHAAGETPSIVGAHAEPTDAASLTVTDVRVGAHDGFDRVVYEFDGSGTPGWTVRYVDAAVQDGSGATLDVPGLTILEVSLTGTGYPFDTGVEPYEGANPLPGTGAVTEVRMATVFEGITQSFIGLADPARPATVSLLTDPVRVVVDIEH